MGELELVTVLGQGGAWFTTALAGVAGGVLGAVLVLLAAVRLGARRLAQAREALEARTLELERRLESGRRELRVLCAAASEAGDRLAEAERGLKSLRARQEQLAAGAEGAPSGLREAAALLDRGASPEEPTELCGLARGEAELVSFLHRNGLAAGTERGAVELV